jgi:hypothetical protein
MNKVAREGEQPGAPQKPLRKRTPLRATRSMLGVLTPLHPAIDVWAHDISSAIAISMLGRVDGSVANTPILQSTKIAKKAIERKLNFIDLRKARIE